MKNPNSNKRRNGVDQIYKEGKGKKSQRIKRKNEDTKQKTDTEKLKNVLSLNGNGNVSVDHKKSFRLEPAQPHIRSYSDPSGQDLNVIDDIQALFQDEWVCNQCFKAFKSENDGYADKMDDIWYCNDCWDSSMQQNAIAAARERRKRTRNEKEKLPTATTTL